MVNDDAKSLIDASNSDANSLHVRNARKPSRTNTLVKRKNLRPISGWLIAPERVVRMIFRADMELLGI
jgi:hypothetical protein